MITAASKVAALLGTDGGGGGGGCGAVTTARWCPAHDQICPVTPVIKSIAPGTSGTCIEQADCDSSMYSILWDGESVAYWSPDTHFNFD